MNKLSNKTIAIGIELIIGYLPPIIMEKILKDLPLALSKNNVLSNIFKLWKVNLNSDSQEWKNIKMNKTQTNEEQCEAGRRPHISWDHIYPQIKDHCLQVYEGPFENIFIKQPEI